VTTYQQMYYQQMYYMLHLF